MAEQKFTNLSIDVKKLMSIPLTQRVQVAGSAAGSEIFGAMTPSQIAALFPKYYLNKVPSLQDAMSGRETRTGGTGSKTRYDGGAMDSSGGNSATQAPAKPVTPPSVYDRIMQKANQGRKGGVSGVSKSVPRPVRAFLNTISGKGLEGADYNVIVGGKRFKDFSKHPGVVGIVTAQGPSTAAGRYQFTQTTWKDMQRQYPGEFEDFSPETQDKAAWYLARDDYMKKTGRDLSADLESKDIGVIRNIGKVLSGRWSSLEGGVHQGSGAMDFTSNYLKNFQAEIESDTQDILKDNSDIPEGENRHTDGETDTGLRDDNTKAAPVPVPFDPTMFSEEGKKAYEAMTEQQKAEIQKAIESGHITMNDVNTEADAHKGESATTVAGKLTADISSNLDQDPLEFWKARNPNRSSLDGVDPASLRTNMMAAIKLEADYAAKGTPKRVEMYGPGAGVRHKHGGGEHTLGKQSAMDIAIYDVDPETGQTIRKGQPGAKSGAYGNYSNKDNHGGVDPEGFALYHEMKANQELARIHLSQNMGEEGYDNWGVRDGALFSDVKWDYMHSDKRAGVNPKTGVSDHVAPHGIGSVAYGHTKESLRIQGIDPNSVHGQTLMTGVVERFGDTKEALAASAMQAYGPKPEADVATVNNNDVPAPEPTNVHTTAPTPENPEGTDTGLRGAPVTPPEQKALPGITDTAVPYEDLTVPKLKFGGEYDMKGEDTVEVNKEGDPVAMTMKDEVKVPTDDGAMQVVSPRADPEKVSKIKDIVDDDGGEDDSTDSTAKAAKPDGQPAKPSQSAGGQQRETPNSGEVSTFGEGYIHQSLQRAFDTATLRRSQSRYGV
jgi:muramidase (phage lysozyme)